MRRIQLTCGSICRLTTTMNSNMLQLSHKKELGQPVVAAVATSAGSSRIATSNTSGIIQI